MNKILKMILFAAMLVPVFQAASFAVEPDEELEDPVLEERARDISQHLRCVVCQNQSIDDSTAPLARDLRIIIRERLVEGDTNDEVVQFVTQRYGDFVLLKPPFKGQTYILWFGPFFILLIGAGLVFLYFKKVMKPAEDGKGKGNK